MNDIAFVPILAAFADTFKTVLGVLLALAGLGVGLQGVVGLAGKSWKTGATFLGIGAALLIVGLHLAGAIAKGLENIVGAVVALSGLLFLGLGVIALPGPTKPQGLAYLGGGALLIVAGLWIMGAL